MIVNGMNKNPKGMSKEEKIGIALGAVVFIVVLLFFCLGAGPSQLGRGLRGVRLGRAVHRS